MNPSRPLLNDHGLPWLLLAGSLALTAWLWNDHRQNEWRAEQALFQLEVSNIRTELTARIAGHSQVLRVAAALFSSTDRVRHQAWRDYGMPVLIDEMLKTRPPAVFLSIHDGSDQSAEHLLYANAAQERLAAALFVHRENISFGGRTWRMEYASRPEFEALVGNGNSSAIGGGGVLVSLLLFGIAWLLVHQRERALRLARDIASERTRDLERERLRLQALMKTASDGIHILDAEGLLVEANAAFLGMLGRDESAIGRLRVTDWEVQRDRAAAQKVISTLINAQSSTLFESQHKRSDGSLIEVEIHARGIVIEGQNLVYCAARDITQRKRAEVDLRKLARAVEQGPASIVVCDLAGNIEYVNPRFEMITGYTSAEVLGANPRFLKSGHTPAETYREIWTAISTGGQWCGELYNRRKDGSLFWEQAALSALKDENGKVTHYVGVKENITERKQAEEIRARLSAIVESSNDAIISRALDGTVLTWNAGAQRMFGYSAAEIISKSVNITFPSDRQLNVSKINVLLLQGEVVHGESQRITKDGRVLDVFSSHSPIKDASGNVVAVSVIIQDITERKANEAERRMLVRMIKADILDQKRDDELLHTYQIKLERQNEELTQAQLKLDPT